MLDVRWRGRLLRKQGISAEYVRNNSGENILEHFAKLPDIAPRAVVNPRMEEAYLPPEPLGKHDPLENPVFNMVGVETPGWV